jgi:hypothetical protein
MAAKRIRLAGNEDLNPTPPGDEITRSDCLDRHPSQPNSPSPAQRLVQGGALKANSYQ